jgi:hypothetical protein
LHSFKISDAYDVTLTLAEKNAVFRWVEEVGYKPFDFRWEESIENEPLRNSIKSFRTSKLVHKATAYFFIFGGAWLVYSPGLRTKTATENHFNNWQNKHDYFTTWLRRLSLEVDAPDLWAIAAAEQEIIEAAQSEELNNKTFSRNEKKLISAKLEELRNAVIQSQSLDQDRAAFVEKQFQYLREASDRLGRKDWINVAITTFISIATSVLVDDEKRRWFIQAASEMFRWIWNSAHLIQN